MSIFIIKLLQYLKCRGNINVQKETKREKSRKESCFQNSECKHLCAKRGKSVLLWKGKIGWVIAVLDMKPN